jgi:hypothetical protein
LALVGYSRIIPGTVGTQLNRLDPELSEPAFCSARLERQPHSGTTQSPTNRRAIQAISGRFIEYISLFFPWLPLHSENGPPIQGVLLVYSIYYCHTLIWDKMDFGSYKNFDGEIRNESNIY